MNSDITKLLRETANTLAALADAFDQELNNTNYRLNKIECDVDDTKQTLKDAASMIMSRL
jgi:hypothetical protein